MVQALCSEVRILGVYMADRRIMTALLNRKMHDICASPLATTVGV